MFVPLLLEAFGIRWFEEGSLSVELCCELREGDMVQPCIDDAEFPDGDSDGGMTLRVWAKRRSSLNNESEGSTLVVEGTAGVGNSQLTRKNSHMFANLSSVSSGGSEKQWGVKVGEETKAVKVLLEKLDDRINSLSQSTLREELKQINMPHDWYTEAKGGESPWGQAIMPPGVVYKMVQPCPLLQKISSSSSVVSKRIASIELRFFLGPLVLGVEYECSHETVAIAEGAEGCTEGGAWVSSFLRDAESGDTVVEVVVEHRVQLADQSREKIGDKTTCDTASADGAGAPRRSSL
jgi:hypothetical protein